MSNRLCVHPKRLSSSLLFAFKLIGLCVVFYSIEPCCMALFYQMAINSMWIFAMTLFLNDAQKFSKYYKFSYGINTMKTKKSEICIIKLLHSRTGFYELEIEIIAFTKLCVAEIENRKVFWVEQASTLKSQMTIYYVWNVCWFDKCEITISLAKHSHLLLLRSFLQFVLW